VQSTLNSTLCRLEQVRGPHNFIAGAGAAFVVAIGIVQVTRAVDTKADKKIIFLGSTP